MTVGSLQAGDFARRARGVLSAIALAASLFLPSQNADAGAPGDCVLSISPASPVSADTGGTVQFSIFASEGSDPLETCSTAQVTISKVSDSTAGSDLTPSPAPQIVFVTGGGTPHTATVQLPASPSGGGSVVFQATCDGGCEFATPSSPTFTINVNDVFNLTFGDPSTGSDFISGNQVLQISVFVSKNGGSASGTEGRVCFDFASNPGGATLTGGVGSCGGGGEGRLADPVSGTAGVTLNAGPFMEQGGTTLISVTGVDFTDSLQLSFEGNDVPGLDPTGGDNQIAAANAQFAQPLEAFAFNTSTGQPLGNQLVTWTINSAPAGTTFLEGPSPLTVSTNSTSGLTAVTLVAGGSPGPVTVSAVLDIDPSAVADFNNLCVEDSCGSNFFQLDYQTPADGIASGTVNVAIPLGVTLTVDGSTPANGETIEFLVVGVSPIVTFSPSPSVVTDINGIASVDMTASTEAIYTVRATAIDPIIKRSVGARPVSRDFTVTVEKVRTLELPVDSNDGASGEPGTNLQLKVLARDDGVLSPPGSPVEWEVLSGDASLTSPSTSTDGSGAATNTLTLGGTPGAVVVRAYRFGSPEVRPTTVVAEVQFTLETFTFALSHPSAGDDAPAGMVGDPIALNALLQRIGASTTPASGEQIHYSIQGGPIGHMAFLDPSANATTDINGLAAVNLIADLAGTYSVQVEHPLPAIAAGARAKGIAATTITYTVSVSAVNRTLDIVSGDGQTALAGDPLPLPLVVEALDDGSAPSLPLDINWSVSPTGAATVTPNPSAVDANGRASVDVTLAPALTADDVITITAARGDEPTAQASFSITVQAPIVRTLSKPATDSGDGQSGQVGTVLPLPLRALAEDSSSPAPGVMVNWAVSGDATLSATQTTTDALGLTGVQVTLGSTVQAITITASRQDAPDATTSYVVNAVAELLIEISPSSQVVGSGGTVTFEVTITNGGDSDLTNLAVTSNEASNCNLSLPVLAAGASHTYTCTLANVTANVEVQFTIEATAQTEAGPATISSATSSVVTVSSTVAPPVLIPATGWPLLIALGGLLLLVAGSPLRRRAPAPRR